MMIRITNLPHTYSKPIVGRIVSLPFMNNDNKTILAIRHNDIPKDTKLDFDFINISDDLFPFAQDSFDNILYGIYSGTLNLYEDGDIIVLKPNGSIDILFRSGSKHNCLFVTERCNCNCLMCSQPPKTANDIPYWQYLNDQLIELISKETEILGISGGEPTLLGHRLFSLLENIKLKLPNTNIDILTNGRAFAWKNNTKRLAEINFPNLLLSIPLHSDYHILHDYITQTKESFSQTVTGIQNLSRYNQRIEIRVVLHYQSVLRLKSLARFIYMNMPFVEHVAFMGLEYIGYTPYNDHLLWIDPTKYMPDLSDAIEYLSLNGLNVSIYNLQLCLLPDNLWKYSVSAISDWKRIYLEKCWECCVKDKCGGIFASSQKKLSDSIKPITQV